MLTNRGEGRIGPRAISVKEPISELVALRNATGRVVEAAREHGKTKENERKQKETKRNKSELLYEVYYKKENDRAKQR